MGVGSGRELVGTGFDEHRFALGAVSVDLTPETQTPI
jgi:hypothetical protein